MKKGKTGTSKASPLQKKRDEQLSKSSHHEISKNSDTDTLRIIQELQVHKIELEMQNEELRLLRDKAEKATKRLADLYDFAPAGYFTLDAEGHILELNLSGAKLLGWNRSDLINNLLINFVCADNFTDFTEFLRIIFKTFVKQTCQVRLKNPVNPLSYTFLEGIISEDENQCYITAFDINKIIKSEKIINQNIGAWELNLVTGEAWRSLKHDQIFGYKKLLPGWTFDIFIGHVFPDDRALVKEKFDKALATGSDWNFECRIFRTDDTVRWIWATGKPEFNERDEPVLIAGLVQDITDRKLAEEEMKNKIKESSILNRKLQNANHELSEFAYTASHQLQEPIRTVSNFMKIIEEDYSAILDNQALKYIRIINDATKRMSSLINSLMAFSTLGQNLKLAKVDCKLLIDNVIDDLEYLIKSTSTTIEVSEMPVLYIYEVELRQLFQNLITNAIKFQKKDVRPRIRIQSLKLINKWQFSVSDNGIGIAPEHFERIFDIFQRLHNNEEQFEGKGIGLAYCKKIVLLHEGEIWIESTLGEGSAFHFTIPELSE